MCIYIEGLFLAKQRISIINQFSICKTCYACLKNNKSLKCALANGKCGLASHPNFIKINNGGKNHNNSLLPSYYIS